MRFYGAETNFLAARLTGPWRWESSFPHPSHTPPPAYAAVAVERSWQLAGARQRGAGTPAPRAAGLATACQKAPDKSQYRCRETLSLGLAAFAAALPRASNSLRHFAASSG